ncbi:foldase protein PrsA [Anditalea andensis]|uniref:Peptidylprolyl isomerase n=1 Tax=Anditalea andensis TaxID=1048983 RepID=A0A074KVX6_9BACT|nr:peptidylprolyl isomerase [Anditalea andensis]KEO73089.1 peptidylprolyl isomerase [Anditalea andensis]
MKIKYFHFLILGGMLACAPSAKVGTDTPDVTSAVPLVSIGNERIYADEFLYILEKSQQLQSGEEKSSRATFDKNLDLFINYRLKVKEAEAMGMAESEEFDKEFTIFKEDLKKPFLIKNSLQEGELQKAYYRSKEILKASHILLQFPNNASVEDSIAVYNMALKIKKEAEEGADFNDLAYEHSDDPSAKQNRGDLGYFSALQMVHPFEDAAYELSVGSISDPVLTSFGYHIIKLEDRKLNKGEIKVSHILIRLNPADPVAEDRAKRKITDIYTELQKNENSWEEVAKIYSDDQNTKGTGGKLPWFGVGAIIPEFEKAAFALNEVGEISSPVKTPYGYHIIRLEDTKPLASFEELEPTLKSRILRDSRSSLIQSQVVAMQKQKYAFKENAELVAAIKPIIDQSLAISLESVKRQLDDQGLLDTLIISTESKSQRVSDFIRFIEADQAIVRTGPNEFFNPWYSKFVEKILEQVEEDDLMTNNREYRQLIQEYRDGILLFSLMNEQVWQKALEDTLGQREFYESHIDQYQWKERIPAVIIEMNKEEQLEKIRRFLSDKDYNVRLKPRLEDQFLNDYPSLFTVQDGTYEYEKHPLLSKVDVQKKNHEIKNGGRTHFLILGNVLPAGPRRLSETTGKVIQDYQEYLDKKMIAELREKYVIQINEDEKERIFEIVKE